MKHPIVKVLLVLGLAVGAGGAKTAQPTPLRTGSGVEFSVLGEKPAKPVATLFVFALDMQTTLRSADFNRIGAILGDEGFVCVSLDAPCHGADNVDKHQNSLVGWRERIERGDDLLGRFTTRCADVLEHIIAEGWTDPNRVFAAGTSRGGFLALHFAAAEPRVRAVAAFAPVTRLRALDEFKGMNKPAVADALSLVNVAHKLAGRPIWLCIGNDDRRVGTNDAIAFSRKVVEASVVAKKPALIEIHVTTTKGHSVHPSAHAEAAAWLVKIVKEQ